MKTTKIKFKPNMIELIKQGRKTQMRRLHSAFVFDLESVEQLEVDLPDNKIMRLKVLESRKEYLQDITLVDVEREGLGPYEPLKGFPRLWDGLQGDGSWGQNPRVWVITFKYIDTIDKNDKATKIYGLEQQLEVLRQVVSVHGMVCGDIGDLISGEKEAIKAQLKELNNETE